MTPPTIPPGLYRWPTGRVYSHEELAIIDVGGVWHVIPRAALAQAGGAMADAGREER